MTKKSKSRTLKSLLALSPLVVWWFVLRFLHLFIINKYVELGVALSLLLLAFYLIYKLIIKLKL